MGGPPENGHVEGLGAVPTHNGWRANHAIPTEGGWIALEGPRQGESEDCTIVMTRDRGGDPGGEKEKDVRESIANVSRVACVGVRLNSLMVRIGGPLENK